MNIDEIITKCNIGEDHLTQEEYEQVGRWLEDYRVTKFALYIAANFIELAIPQPRAATGLMKRLEVEEIVKKLKNMAKKHGRKKNDGH